MGREKEKGKGDEPNQELRVRISVCGGMSAPFKSPIGQLGGMSGQAGLLRQWVMGED